MPSCAGATQTRPVQAQLCRPPTHPAGISLVRILFVERVLAGAAAGRQVGGRRDAEGQQVLARRDGAGGEQRDLSLQQGAVRLVVYVVSDWTRRTQQEGANWWRHCGRQPGKTCPLRSRGKHEEGRDGGSRGSTCGWRQWAHAGEGEREGNGAPTCVFHPAVDGAALRGPIWPNPHRMVHHLPALLGALVLGMPQAALHTFELPSQVNGRQRRGVTGRPGQKAPRATERQGTRVCPPGCSPTRIYAPAGACQAPAGSPFFSSLRTFKYTPVERMGATRFRATAPVSVPPSR